MTLLLIRRYKSGPRNEYKDKGFRLAWTAVTLPRLIEDASGNVYGKHSFLSRCISYENIL